MISLKQINYALAVEKTLHFKRAAEMCSVSQSALSASISELENTLNIRIFERDNRKVLITPIGHKFLDKARKVKSEVEDIYRITKAGALPLSEPMTMGIISSVGAFLLPRVLPATRQQHPAFQLKIIEDKSQTLIELVKRGELDTAIIALPTATEGLKTFTFWQEDFYVVAHKDERFSNPHEVSAEEVKMSKIMLLKKGHCLREHIISVCALNPHETREPIGDNSLYTLVQMVAGKMGTTLVPHMALDQMLQQSDQLKAVHLNQPGPHRQIAFVTRTNYANTESIEMLASLFAEQLKKSSAANQFTKVAH